MKLNVNFPTIIMAGVFDIDIHDPDMGNNVDFENEDSDDDVIEVEVIPFFHCSFY